MNDNLYCMHLVFIVDIRDYKCCCIDNFRQETDKTSDKCIICYHFSCKNPTQINKFIILCHFCLDKISGTQHSPKQLLFE